MSGSKVSRFLSDFSDNHPIASSALSFGAAGASAAAVLSLIRELRTAMEERKKEREIREDGIGPNTIVLRIPKKSSKAAEADPEVSRAQESSHDRVVSVRSTVEKEMPVESHATAGLQRDLHGKFTDAGEKMASTSVTNRAGQILAGVGGATVGYVLVKKLYEKMEQRRLKRQIEAAQQEYLGLIDGSSSRKYASVRSAFLMDDPAYGSGPEKRAGVVNTLFNLPNDSKNLTAAALASYIMMALGTGYVTKKVLESKFDQDEKNEEEPPKINRILFKSSSAEEPLEIGPDVALATIGVMSDCMRDSLSESCKEAADYEFLDKVTGTPEGKQWLIDAYASSRGKGGKVPDDIPGLGFMGKLTYANTLSDIKADPEAHAPGIRMRVMKLIKGDPKGWFSAIGDDRNKKLVSDLASDALWEGLSRGEFGWFAGLPGIRHLIGALGGLYLGTGPGRRMAMRRVGREAGLSDVETDSAMKGPSEGSSKKAMDMSDISAMMSRSAILSDKRNTDLDRKLDEILEKLPVKKKKKVEHATDIDVGRGDEDAEEFVMANGGQIARILNGMKEKGLVA